MKCPSCKEELTPAALQFITEVVEVANGHKKVKYTCKLCWDTFSIR